MHKIIICLLLTTLIGKTYAQDKKVAIVTFFADKRVGTEALNTPVISGLIDLENDPNFNLAPLIADFHTQFLENYSKDFPFQLVPEADVFNDAGYKAFVPELYPGETNDKLFSVIDGYKVVEHQRSSTNKKNLLDIFNRYDGIMLVYISFSFQPGIMIGGSGTMKMRAYAHITLINKNGDKVFAINEYDVSRKTSAVIGGVPVMKPEKVLPMCESALTELMAGLQKKMPKIIRKSEAKL